MIVLLCGPPGTGKTTIARGVRERLAARGLSIRLLHSDEFSRRTYEQMYEQVAGSGEDWLLDGTFYKREFRERFRGLDDARIVSVTASLETCLERNRARADPISETGVHVVYREFEPIDADLVVDTDELSAEEGVERVTGAITDWRKE